MQYERFTLFVSGLCKSAGTLVAVGAHELIMSDYGELGPLDVQMPKQDAVWEMQSGLTVMSTLNTLQHTAARTFGQIFSSLLQGPSSITLKTAAEIATKMTIGLYSPLYSIAKWTRYILERLAEPCQSRHITVVDFWKKEGTLPRKVLGKSSLNTYHIVT